MISERKETQFRINKRTFKSSPCKGLEKNEREPNVGLGKGWGQGDQGTREGVKK